MAKLKKSTKALLKTAQFKKAVGPATRLRVSKELREGKKQIRKELEESKRTGVNLINFSSTKLNN